MCMYVNEICAEGIFVSFLLGWWLKNVTSRSKYTFFQMSTIFKFDFQNKKTITFLKEN